MSGLLRICTAGSVDDGKSTLIGRLLHDSQSVYEDQVHSVKVASTNRGVGPIDYLAVHRRPQGRARAGHHDRRRLPLLRDGEAQVHPRRHAGTRAVHAQHGHRRVDGGRRHPAGRRAPGRTGAVAAPRADRPAARDHATSCSPSTRWTWSTSTATCSTASGTSSRRSCTARGSTRFRSAPCWATTSSRQARARRGSRGRACWNSSRRSRSRATHRRCRCRFPVQLVVRPTRRIPWLRRADCVGHGAGRRHGARLAVRAQRPGQTHRDLRRRPGPGVLAHVRHPHPGRRDRHQPRRRDRERAADGRAAVRGRDGLDGRATARSRRASISSSTRQRRSPPRSTMGSC